MLAKIKEHPKTSALILMLVIATPLMFSPLGYFPIHPVGGERIIVMDGLFTYDREYILDTFMRLGDYGREVYFKFHIGDCLFALSYGLLCWTLLRPLMQSKPLCIGISILPATFDILENSSIEIMSAQYPNVSEGLAGAAAIFSSLKWIFLLLWLITTVTLRIRKPHTHT